MVIERAPYLGSVHNDGGATWTGNSRGPSPTSDRGQRPALGPPLHAEDSVEVSGHAAQGPSRPPPTRRHSANQRHAHHAIRNTPVVFDGIEVGGGQHSGVAGRNVTSEAVGQPLDSPGGGREVVSGDEQAGHGATNRSRA